MEEGCQSHSGVKDVSQKHVCGVGAQVSPTCGSAAQPTPH